MARSFFSNFTDWRVGRPGFVVHWGLRVVVEHLVDIGEHLRSELVEDIQSLKAVLKLLNVTSPNEGRVQVLIVDGPRNCHMKQLAFELLLCVLLYSK